MNKKINFALVLGAIAGVMATTGIVALSMEVRERNNTIASLNDDVAFGIKEANKLQTDLDTLTEEYGITLEEKEELGIEAEAAKVEAEAQATEASKQKGYAYNAQQEKSKAEQERDDIKVARDEIAREKEQILKAVEYYYLMAVEMTDAKDFMAQAAAEILYENYDSAGYYIDLAAASVEYAEYYQSLGDAIINSL